MNPLNYTWLYLWCTVRWFNTCIHCWGISLMEQFYYFITGSRCIVIQILGPARKVDMFSHIKSQRQTPCPCNASFVWCPLLFFFFLFPPCLQSFLCSFVLGLEGESWWAACLSSLCPQASSLRRGTGGRWKDGERLSQVICSSAPFSYAITFTWEGPLWLNIIWTETLTLNKHDGRRSFPRLDHGSFLSYTCSISGSSQLARCHQGPMERPMWEELKWLPASSQRRTVALSYPWPLLSAR